MDSEIEGGADSGRKLSSWVKNLESALISWQQ